MSLPVASGCLRVAGHAEVFAECTEIWDGPIRPLVGGSGNLLNLVKHVLSAGQNHPLLYKKHRIGSDSTHGPGRMSPVVL